MALPSPIDWSQWPTPDPTDGDGSDFAESDRNDGRPGAVPPPPEEVSCP